MRGKGGEEARGGNEADTQKRGVWRDRKADRKGKEADRQEEEKRRTGKAQEEKRRTGRREGESVVF